MASKVAECYVALSAKTDQLKTDLQKGQVVTKANTDKTVALSKKTDADEKKNEKLKAETKLKDQKTLYSRMAAQTSSLKEKSVAAFNGIQGAMNKTALGGLALIGAFTAFARASEFPQAKVLERQFDALKNELYMALIPAIQMLFPVFERLRVIVYQNRGFFQDMGTIAARALGFIVEVLGKVLQKWDDLNPQVKKFLMVFAPIAIAAAVVGAKLMFLAPLIGKIAAAIGGIITPIGLIATAFAAPLAYAALSEKFAGRMGAAFQKIVGVVMYVKDAIMNALVRVWAIVKPVWEKYVDFVVTKFEAITNWLDGNKADFEKWAYLVGDIIGNMIADAVAVWQWFLEVVGSVLTAIGDASGITWGDIKQLVTDVLEFIALVTSNTGLSIQIVWTAIKLGAVSAWDFIQQSFWKMIGSIAAGFMSLVAAAKGVWQNIQAVFSGGDTVDVGKMMAEQFAKTYNEVTAGKLGPSAAKQQLIEEMDRLIEQLKKGRAKQKKEGDDAVEEANKGGGGNKQTGAPPPVYTIKFETVGLKDMWKKMQESLTGQSMMGLAQRQAKAAEENVIQARMTQENTKKIAEKIGNQSPARAG